MIYSMTRAGLEKDRRHFAPACAAPRSWFWLARSSAPRPRLASPAFSARVSGTRTPGPRSRTLPACALCVSSPTTIIRRSISRCRTDRSPVSISILARAICEDLKLTCTIQARRFDHPDRRLNTGEGDAIIASLRIDAEPRAKLDFTAPYMKDPGAFRRPQGGAAARRDAREPARQNDRSHRQDRA